MSHTFSGEKKLEKLQVPDVWKKGSRNTLGGKDGGTKLNMNMKIEKKRFKYKFRILNLNTYGNQCRLCKKRVPSYAHYCQHCSYDKGLLN